MLPLPLSLRFRLSYLLATGIIIHHIGSNVNTFLNFFQKNLKRILEAIFNLSFVRYRVLFFNNLNLQIVKVNLIDKIVLIETRFGVALELIDR